MEEIYFDNSATTKMSEAALKKMIEVIENHYGNPSSLHSRGLDAEKIKEEARNSILQTLSVRRGVPGELVFTSGGTESNNIAMLGSVFAKTRKGNEKIMITAGEHSSVENTACFLENKGFTVYRVPTREGQLDLDFVRENGKDVILASFMHVNNETGALYNLKEAFTVLRALSPNIVTHADCVQSYMKVRFTPKSLGADLISISSHKINGAKGVGALYVSPEIIKAKKLSPIVYGGGQEENFRSGTENVYGIASFGEAAKSHYESLSQETEKMNSLREYLIEGLSGIDGIVLNLPKDHAPHILNITVKGIRSETVLHFLSSKGIYVSSGSACSSHSKNVSRALVAFGVSEEDADCSIRVSLCPQNTKGQADIFYEAIREGINRLVKK